MRAWELTEGKNTPCIVVDIQPAYLDIPHGYGETNFSVFRNAARFLQKQTGPILMFVNAEDQSMTEDTVAEIKMFWEENLDFDNWSRVTINDKGFGYLRAWMDKGVPESAIIKTIREMYQQKVTDSRELFDGDESETFHGDMEKLIGEFHDWMIHDNISIEWTSVAQLKKFNGAYIMGGAEKECLREVELLMNAFNIKYKEIADFIY